MLRKMRVEQQFRMHLKVAGTASPILVILVDIPNCHWMKLGICFQSDGSHVYQKHGYYYWILLACSLPPKVGTSDSKRRDTTPGVVVIIGTQDNVTWTWTIN